jgi:hypothetical protein
MKSFKEYFDEDGAVAANAVGGGQVAGIGVGPNGEPGINKKKKKSFVLATISRRVSNAKP